MKYNIIKFRNKVDVIMGDVKTINSLMAYLREENAINIKGSLHKRKLRNLGYYHGYKGYRFIKSIKKPINIDTANLNKKYKKMERNENQTTTFGQNQLINFQPL